jgi:hypothetical protein
VTELDEQIELAAFKLYVDCGYVIAAFERYSDSWHYDREAVRERFRRAIIERRIQLDAIEMEHYRERHCAKPSR